MRQCDPVTLEVIRGAARAAQAEMEALLERTAMSAFIREKKDFYTALFDADGAMAVGSDLPIFGDIVAPVARQFPIETMQQGDLYWYNDCYGSGGAVSHSNDQVFLAPAFHAGERIGFVMGWAHFSDIGGLRPGSLSPDATDHFQEGIIIPPVRLMRAGQTNEDLLRSFWRNSRFPTQSQGDTRALMAAVRLGEKRLADMAERLGSDILADAFRQLLARTENVVRQQLKSIFPVGKTEFADAIDSDGQGNGPFTLRVSLTRTKDDQFIFDATETDDQAPGPVNLLMHQDVPGMALGLYVLQNAPGQVLNAGAPRAIDKVMVREGSLLAPRAPAPLGLRGITMMRLLAALHGLVAKARDGNAPASHSAYVVIALRGTACGKRFLLSDGIGVGYGARPFADGTDAVYFVAQENYPVEFMELSYPVRLRSYGLNKDSGGPGRYRGGAGVIREFEVMAEEAMLAVRIDSVRNPPWGVAGGMNGGAGRAIVNPGTLQERILAPLSDGTMLKKGDIFRIETGGGGGWGHPFDRPAPQVREDFLGGVISVEAAARDYGVILVNSDIDHDATASRRSNRTTSALFHRNGYRNAVS
jgi:N-methylhydantoinase B